MRRHVIAAALAAIACSTALAQQGVDSIVLVGDDGVLLVDSSVTQMRSRIKAAIAMLSTKPIKLVINTHAHAYHFGANDLMALCGAVIAARPTRDLDARWAPRGGFLSGGVITRMAYQSLEGISPPARQ